MIEPFDVLILDTYGVLYERSPLYLNEKTVEDIEPVSHPLSDEERFWRRVRRRYEMNSAEVERVLDIMAEKYCRNLDIWKELPGWSTRFRLAMLHPGPVGLLRRWDTRFRSSRRIPTVYATADLRLRPDDPALYHLIAAQAGVAPDRCLLVDDERGPFDAAHAAGMGSYRYGTAYGLRAVLRERERAFGA